MQKNWYMVYTKPKCEKKVAILFAKRKIENFCPLNCKQIKHFRKNKFLYEPLFTSYVFVKVEESDLPIFKQIEHVVSLVYWKGKPAIINEQEIQAIKEFATDHSDITLKRCKINQNAEPRNIDESSYTLDGKILMIKKRSFSISLPSIGFTLSAPMGVETLGNFEHAFNDNTKLLLQ